MGPRSILYGLWYYGVTAGLAILYIPLLALPRRVLGAGIRVWAKLLIWGMRVIGGVKLEVRGLERLPKGVPVLLAAKHQSMFDVVPAFAYMPDAMFVMKRELMRIPVFGWHNSKHGTIVVDRQGHSQAMRKMIAEARERFKEPRQLVIFPEGTRRAPGAEPDYKPGVAGLYRDLNVPCVPVATNTGAHISTSGVARSCGTVVYEVLEPIPAGLKRADFMRLLQERIETASNALLANTT
ncbi:MAG TPA: lysophospholipid acyltransferase family protein [Caulobacteraceae bacterium]